MIYTDLENIKKGLANNFHAIGTKEETFVRANLDTSNVSQNASNIFELSEADKLRHKLKLAEKEKETLNEILTDIQLLFSQKPEYKHLPNAVEELNLRLQK